MLNSPPVHTARIVLIEPDGKCQEIAIAASPFHIGREAGNELTLYDSRISRRQARIVAGDGAYVLEDMESLHGTFVNGQKVQRHELHPNDCIEFGVAYSYRVVFMGDAANIDKVHEKVAVKVAPGGGPRGIHHLGVLLEVARTVGTGLSLEDVLTTVVDAALELTHTQRGLLLLRNAAGKLEPVVARDAQRTKLSLAQTRVSSSVIKRVLTARRELIVSNVGDDIALGQEESVALLDLHTVIAIPIDKLPLTEILDLTVATHQGEILGVLYLDSHLPSSAFTDLDREVLRTLAREAAVVVENAQLLAASRAKARLDHEIEIASEIQRQLQPRSFPRRPEFEVVGFMLPCQSVGGDCFDVVELDGGRYCLCVGDIAGKGVSASLLASMVQGMMNLLVSLSIPMEQIASRLNRYICDHSPSDRYVTLFYGCLEPSGRFNYLNAGHVPTLIRRRSGELDALESENFPVGMFDDAEYVSASTQIEKNDYLVIYSDGVPDATNVRGERFEESRLRNLLRQFQGQNVDQLAEAIRVAVQNFTEGAPQSDDITVLVARYLGATA